MKKLVFDTSSAQDILDSDSVGAWVRAGDDGTLIGHVSDALKVNFSNTTIDVTATDLDIRDLTQADEITVFQGTSPWVVSATDLDIRNLDYSLDNVAIKGATGNQLVVEADGSINVNADISVVNGHEKAEDSAHVSGDIGSYVLAVRQDTLASSTSADGDYSSLKTSAAGALYVNLAESSALIEVSDAALANTAIFAARNVLNVADTAENLIASPLTNRKYLYVQNMDTQDIFIGQSGITAANGFPLPGRLILELRCGAAVDVEFVGRSGRTPEVATLELA